MSKALWLLYHWFVILICHLFYEFSCKHGVLSYLKISCCKHYTLYVSLLVPRSWTCFMWDFLFSINSHTPYIKINQEGNGIVYDTSFFQVTKNKSTIKILIYFFLASFGSSLHGFLSRGAAYSPSSPLGGYVQPPHPKIRTHQEMSVIYT